MASPLRRPSRSLGNGKVELRGLSALEAWARKVTTGFKDVKVTDLSNSFKDGLAFCAVICHHRPDLIDFDSLSKENVYFNNHLAFTVAEQQLGIPALLDAEDFLIPDMEPDRASIATYLSQLYEKFNGKRRESNASSNLSSPTGVMGTVGNTNGITSPPHHSALFARNTAATSLIDSNHS